MGFQICLAVLALAVCSTANGNAAVERRAVIDEGDYWLICTQEPIDLGIVLDSSASINVGSIHNFRKGLTFLQNVLQKFEIGPGRNEVRVSIIPFAAGVYTDEAFNLDTYTTKQQVLDAVGNIKYKSGGRTDTDQGITYMDTVQMAPAVTRDYAEKIAIVLTDGDSRNKGRTAQAAEHARADGITIFAVGVGRVKEDELLRIAGNMSRVLKVSSYDKLNDIVDVLTKKTCKPKMKPTTTPPPKTACGEDHPADIQFVFSPTDLGAESTIWTTDFINSVVRNEDFEIGFRFGVVSGSCPEDAGFDLNAYHDLDDLSDRLLAYERDRMVDLIERVSTSGFTAEHGGRSDAEDIAVLVLTEHNADGLQQDVDKLLSQGVRVYVVDPTNSGKVNLTGATVISGEEPFEAANHFVSMMCFD